jgi:hypothetical protein
MTPHAQRTAREHKITATRWECVARFVIWGSIVLCIFVVAS